MKFEALGKPIRDRLAKLGIRRADDLVLHLPLRYEDETHLYPIADIPHGIAAQVEGTVIHSEVQFRPRRQLVVRIEDASGVLVARFLHFYPSQQKQLAEGSRVRLIGEVRHGFWGAEMVHPRCRRVDDDTPLASNLTPVYPTVNGLNQPMLRKLIGQALASCSLQDTLPNTWREELGLPGFAQAVQLLHQPSPDTPTRLLQDRNHPGWEQLKFEELLAQQLSMRLAYQARREKSAPILLGTGLLSQQLLSGLPFGLTGAQSRVLLEIRHDLTQPHPMQRLLQGDVGSGKTIVAALSAITAIESGYQAALMAPTEILAEQHYQKLASWLEPLGVRVGWFSGSQKKKARADMQQALAQGDIDLAIGTHALFQEEIAFSRLGLAIIDEQHRFGVHQRLALRAKGLSPHQLMMSATPIPRTLAMSYYADMDVSVIDELPPGRTPIRTRLVSDARRDDITEVVRIACQEGRQVYWVCPLIEESEALQLQTAVDTQQQLAEALPDVGVALLHGRMKPDEKTRVMQAFIARETQVLVATTVIEVGVDVPNASLMIIDHAERMGLSQLHQLRGRVGRGAVESQCILLYSTPLSDTAKARLKVIYEHTDGFEVARQDLQIRGPGEFLGIRQSGTPMLRFADLEKDQHWLEEARVRAETMIRHYPAQAEAHLKRWMEGREILLKA